MLRCIDELLGDVAGSGSRLRTLVHDFSGIVNDPDFPCIYSSLPFTTSQLYFDVIPHTVDSVEGAAVSLLKELCGIIRRVPDAIGVIFVEQQGEESLADDFHLACRIVQTVMRKNELDHPGVKIPEPHESAWELWLDGIGLFMNFSSPRHKARRSRNVGSSFTVIAQARESFDRQGRATPKAREMIRRRLASYDDVAPHPSLGSYHDADSREALQFFLGDGLEPMDPTGACGRESG